MKECTKCKLEKNLKEFSKCATFHDGLQYECKQCKIDFYKTIDGLIIRMYLTQKQTSKRRNHPPPTYTREELEQWLWDQGNFYKLFLAWLRSEYETSLKPSVDRLDDSKPYTLDNIQLITWGENDHKGHESRMKPVLQYENQTEFVINEYKSVSEAQKETGILHIGCVCNGKRPTAGGYEWKFKEI